MPEKVLGILDYGLRAFHRNPGVKTDQIIIAYFYILCDKMATNSCDKYFYKVGEEIVCSG